MGCGYICSFYFLVQHFTSINIGGKVNPHQVNRINTYRLRLIHDYAKEICKLTLCNLFLILPTSQESLRNYQGTKRIITELNSGALAQHQYQNPTYSPPTSTKVWTGGNGGCSRMPWRFHKNDEPSHHEKLWEYIPLIGTNRTYKPRRKSIEYLNKGWGQSSSPGKVGEEITRGKMQIKA